MTTRRIPARVSRSGEVLIAAELSSAAVAVAVASVLRFGRVTAGPNGYYAFAAMLAWAGIAPLIRWKFAAKTAMLSVSPGAVAYRGGRVLAEQVTGFSVARATVGYSVAIARGDDVRFFEVGTREDADALVAAVGHSGERGGTVPIHTPQRWADVVQWVISSITVALAMVYAYVATTPDLSDYKILGLGPIILGAFSTLVMLLRRRSPAARIQYGELRLRGRNARAIVHADRGRAPRVWVVAPSMHKNPRDWLALDANETPHGALHAMRAAGVAFEQREVPAGVERLVRRDETLGQWLARIDAMASATEGYRGDGIERESLLAALRSERCEPVVRAAAARLLARGFGEPTGPLLAQIADEDERAYATAMVDGTTERAAAALSERAPLFRATFATSAEERVRVGAVVAAAEGDEAEAFAREEEKALKK